MLRFGFKNLRHEGSRGLFFSPLPETRRGKLLPLALSLFFIFCLLNANTAFAGSATLAWNPPTERVDGTPVLSSDIKGYNLHYGAASGNYTQTQPITGNVTTYTITNLTDGANYYFAVSAIDTADKESGYSTEACKVIGSTTPCATTTIGGGGGNNNSNLSKGADTSISGGGCGFVKNDGKGQKAKGEGMSLIIMLIIALTGIALARRRTENISAIKEGVLVMETRKNSLIKTAAISFLLTIFWSASSHAQPNITSFSGSLTDGSTITINGSSFGVNGPNIVVFDDFEGGTNSTDIKTGAGSATVGKWDLNCSPGTGYVTYTNTHAHSGSLSFKGDYSINGGAPCILSIPTSSYYDIFVSYWTSVPTDGAFPCGGGCNWKILWSYYTNQIQNDQVIPVGLDSSGASPFTGWALSCNNCATTQWLNPDLSMVQGRWYRVWAWIKRSDGNPNIHKEAYSLSTDDNRTVTTHANWTGSETYNNNSGLMDRISVHAYGHRQAGAYALLDDVYIATGQNARARIEIGNAPTYNASTNLTIATVTSWGDTSITATVRQGSFGNLNNAYLYVIDAAGNVSPGMPLCSTCLKAPTW